MAGKDGRQKREYVTTQDANIEARRTRAMELYLRGRSQREIATELDYSQKQVSRDIQAIREEWKESRIIDLSDHQNQELKKIDGIERAAWEGWERSCKERRVRSLEESSGRTVAVKGKRGAAPPAPTPETKKKLREEDQSGDPRFLQTIAWCVEQRCRILGLNAPKQVALKTDGDRATRLAQLLGTDPSTLPN